MPCSSKQLNLYNCIIYELETCSEEETKERERYHINNTECVNIRKLNSTPQEYQRNNKEKVNKRNREYKRNNKEKVNKSQREYYIRNKEKIDKKTRQQRLDNPELYKKRNREYYIRNKQNKLNAVHS